MLSSKPEPHPTSSLDEERNISPTALSIYLERLDQQVRFHEIDPKTVSTKRSHLRKVGYLLDVPLEGLLDPYGDGVAQVLEGVQDLTVQWASEGKTARTIKSYHDELVCGLVRAMQSQRLDTAEMKRTMQQRLSRIRRQHGPARKKPWSPTGADIKQLFAYLDACIAGQQPRPFARYNATTGEGSRRMSVRLLLRLRAVLVLAICTSARTGELLGLTRAQVSPMGVTRVLTKAREGDEITTPIRSDFWAYIKAWLNALPEDEQRLFPGGVNTLPDQVGAVMRQAGWKARHCGLYAFRRWGLTTLQEQGASDHVIMAVSGHQSKESMTAYTSGHAEGRMNALGAATVQELATALVTQIEQQPSLCESIQPLMERMSTLVNLYSASEVKAIHAVREAQAANGQRVDDVLVVRGEVAYSLEEECAVPLDERKPHLRHAADRFTQRIGSRMSGIRPLGPPVRANGIALPPATLGLKKDHAVVANMNGQAATNERTWQDSNPRSPA